jgi:hypothetical protein
MPAAVMSLVLLVAQVIELGPGLRRLLERAFSDKTVPSTHVRVEDEDSKRRARLRVVVEEGGSTLLFIELDRAHERLLPHTVTLEVDGDSIGLRVLELQLSHDRREPEVVVVMLEEGQLEELAGGIQATLTLQGWEETFTATLEEKGMRRIARLYERQSRASDS